MCHQTQPFCFLFLTRVRCHLGVVSHIYNPSYSGQPGEEGRHEILSEKQTKSKRMGGMAQMVGQFPSICDSLNSLPSTTKAKKEDKERKGKEAGEGMLLQGTFSCNPGIQGVN
jgi:hypothetical protein